MKIKAIVGKKNNHTKQNRTKTSSIWKNTAMVDQNEAMLMSIKPTSL